MKSSQKAAISLLITILLFGGFAALAYTGLFDVIEARFYNPTITSSITREVTRNSAVIGEFFADIQAQLSQTLREPSVRRSFLAEQNAEDIFERSRIYGLLFESIGGFQWARFIDSDGARIHFSTYSGDILSQEPQFVVFRNFSEPEFPYQAIAVGAGERPRFILDGEGDRIFFSFPFYDYFEVYRGTALFSLSARALSDMFIREGSLNVGHNISVISNPPGFLVGTPAVFAEEALISQIASVWREGALSVARLHSAESGIALTLLSFRSPQGFFVGRLVSDDLFLFPETMRILLLLSFFFTVYLTIFLFLNFKQDSVTIIQNRMKKLQNSLIEQYYENKNEVDWSRWSWELEQRRPEISAQLKRGIKIASDNKARDIDAIIDKSWAELLSAIGGIKGTTIDENKLQLLLNRFIATIPNVAGTTALPQITAQPADAPAIDASPAGASSSADAQMPDDLESLQSADDVEELDDLEDEEIDVTEAAELVEALDGDLEELENIEAADDADDEDEEAIEVAQTIKEIEAVEVEASELVEELDEIEPLEELDEPLDELAEETPIYSHSADNIPEVNISRIASEIEFGDNGAPEQTNENETIWDGFEIVSPFSETLSNFADFANDDSAEAADPSALAEAEATAEASAEAEAVAEEIPPAEEEGKKRKKKTRAADDTLADAPQGFSLVSQPLFNISGARIETLEALPDEDEETASLDHAEVIEEHEGIHYINEDALKPSDEAEPDLDREFKNLVDSVMK
ncbi:MAG: hypothetical protein FWC65_02490 [Treponema sp.]|nr:hypothetical protein [Treponema sp.]